MQNNLNMRGVSERRPAVVLVFTLVMVVVLCGFAALTIDVGLMYNTRADLQRAADAAALAAAGSLSRLDMDDSADQAYDVARKLVEANPVLGRRVTVDEHTDITIGQAKYDPGTNSYDFTPTNSLADAVRVRVRQTDDSPNGPTSLLFARIFGKSSMNISAEAIAYLGPRDIALVADLSASENDDSELQHYKRTEINLYDVWAGLPSESDLSPQTDDLGFTSTVEVTDNGDGTSTVTIALASDGSAGTPALSHLTLGLPEGAHEMAAATATSEGGYPIEVGTDPQTGVSGIKFDETNLGEDGVAQSETFTFVIPNDQLAYLEVATKAGTLADLSEYNLFPGPVWGYMEELGYGTINLDESYEPSADPGLIRLPYTQNWSNASLELHLANLGYSSDEIDAILSGAYDRNGAYPSRVAVALGLAYWNSGYPGGLWDERGVPAGQTGDRDARVEAGELEWVEPIFDRSITESKAIWFEFIDYVRNSRTTMVQANSGFQYRYGVKTFVNFLLESQTSAEATPELSETPSQPLQAIKDAVGFMAALIEDLDTNDQMSLEVYGETAVHEVDLTDEYQKVTERLAKMQAGHYDSWTNMGGGIATAITELTGDHARKMSQKVMILLTDGIANVNSHGGTNDYAGGRDYALAEAKRAA
ncbi:MAG: VWA domain-containing protein, partial [Planctomycetes bacterium]|nr:VWA domain-containing protein [Planctomycetota bacterium]